MAHFTLQVTSDGPILKAGVSVSKGRAEALQKADKDVPARVLMRALVDTGASCTCIDPTILNDLGLTPTGIVPMFMPSTGAVAQDTDQYDVGLFITSDAQHPSLIFDTLPVIATDLSVQGIQGLIGRDILDQCVLIYNGNTRLFTLAF